MTAQQTFEDQYKAIYRFAYRLTGRADLAEDITQDCFLAFLRNPHHWDPKRGEIRTYLSSIARNLTFKHYRDNHSDRYGGEEDARFVADARPGQELSVAVAQTVAQLPDLQREVLILFEYEGFHLSEIAGIVSADIGVVKSRLHRARARLKRMLAPYRKVATHANVQQ